jgi:hypothetical protein
MENLINTYLRELERGLRLSGTFDPDALAEIESHLLESVDGNLLRGLKQAEAEQEALKRFGSVKVISSTFESGRIRPMQKILLAIAVVSGWFITYVDSRPTWDDTGITASIILLVCGVIALIGYRRPWLLALAVGAWIPLYGLFVTHNYASILALLIAFVGAYAGWGFRSGVNKIMHTT